MNYEIKNGDSWELLKELPDNSIGSLVTDPPYLIDFMGNQWDSANSPAGDKEFWSLVLSKMKHGAHGVVFGHSRQHHRVMVALEDAGFEIRDTLMWMYGQGFPKNHNIGKAVDKLQGNKREEVGDNPNHRTSEALYKLGFQGGKGDGKITQGHSSWEGWGTALKPAYEPIILVRKPLGKKLTIAKNCLEHGVGGLNIDDSRIGANDKAKFPEGNYTTDTTVGSIRNEVRTADTNPTGRFPANVLISHNPDCKHIGSSKETYGINKTDGASFFGQEKCPDYTAETTEVHNDIYECVDDCPIAILDKQAPKAGSLFSATRKKDTTGGSGASWVKAGGNTKGEDNGAFDEPSGASRFFYQPKIRTTERNWGMTDEKNIHPTVKPVALMHYLIRLITPKGETVLDPFAGSGSTGMACVLTDNDFVGFDMDEKFCSISEKRIEYVVNNKQKVLKEIN
jgi:DNA modification methylase